jgi:hypothetical protein
MKYETFIKDATDEIVKLGEYATQDEAFSAGQSAGWCSVLLRGADGLAVQAIGFAYNRPYKQQNGRKGVLWNIVLF